MEDKTIYLKITNDSKSKLLLIVEPWAIENTIECNSSFEFYLQGPDEELMEIEYKENRLIIHGWPESTTSARTNEAHRTEESMQ